MSNMRTVTKTGTLELEADAERAGFRVDMAGAGTVEFEKGGGEVPIKAGSFYEPLVCPTGHITIKSTQPYVVTLTEG